MGSLNHNLKQWVFFKSVYQNTYFMKHFHSALARFMSTNWFSSQFCDLSLRSFEYG